MIGDVIHISPIAITNVILNYEGRVIGDLYLVKKNSSITDLNGLGKEIWKGVDVNKYVENERQW